jgi:NhaA family Na+:H+ antiporter
MPLFAGAVVAIFWANLNFAGYQSFNSSPFFGGLSFHFVANELFMVLFFGIAAAEITRSFLPGGDLSPISKAVNPLLGTLGGVFGPVAVYFGLNALIGTPELKSGWGIPTATDIALAWLAARTVFGAAHPAVSYLLLLAVADDAIGLAIIAIFYPSRTMPTEPFWLLLVALAMAVAWLLRRFNFRSYWPCLLIGGSISWTGLHQAHIHAALALVFIVPFLPHSRQKRHHLFEEGSPDHSPLSSFEHEWKVIVDFGLFMFGLANAGVQFSSIGTVTIIVLLSLLLGKTAGIFLFSTAASGLGFELPRGMKPRDLLTVSLIAGTGFTVALFVAGEAFSDKATLGAARMGALLSVIAALCGLIAGKLLGVDKKHV